MHIILILGTSGDKSIKHTYIFQDKQQEYRNKRHNSTDFFLSLEQQYTILGTKESFEHQLKIFADHPKYYAILEHFNNQAHYINPNDPETLFDKILETLKSLTDKTILIDITHGFRDQPLLATLAALIAKVNFQNKIQLIYARDISPTNQPPQTPKQYRYEMLDEYINIGLKSFLLTSFIQTLTIPKINIQDKLIEMLQNFSQDLHKNNFNNLFSTSLESLKTELQKDKTKALEELILQIKDITNDFETIKSKKYEYEKFYEMATLMLAKNYYLIAATYATETLPRYIKHYFSKHNILTQNAKKNQIDEYTIHNAINQFITSDTQNDKIFNYEKASLFKDKHKKSFETFVKILRGIRKERNNLAHIGSSNAKNNLPQHLNNFKQKFLIQKPFESFNSTDSYDHSKQQAQDFINIL
ncbi:CRISPR-associated DxTHG motif protein [Helicobacter pullorum]|uniref:CRISPR-associated DxTHG motif protein n=1 Tax=Helicobacter pullorum TaxID=35818 RepID=UPI000816A712|nr:TM1812 family CRISPR-associated protein [Helicobacter pullorum]OCR17435.1 hypothetical protein BA915_01070 [Helicobacter pullorum]